jgi:hypothetical protein
VGVEKKEEGKRRPDVSPLPGVVREMTETEAMLYDRGYDAGFNACKEASAAKEQEAWTKGFAAGNLAALGMQYRHLTN